MKKTIALVILALTTVGCEEARLVERSTQNVEAAGVNTLRFDLGAGDLQIVGRDGIEAIDVTLELRTNNPLEAQDEVAIAELEGALQASGGEATLTIADLPPNYYVDVTVELPSRIAIDGMDGSGDIIISDVASLTLRDASGGIELARIPGALDIVDGSGDLVANDIGALTLEDGSGGIDLIGVNGNLTIGDDDGNIFGLNIDGNVDIVDSSGEIELENVSGTVTIEDGSGGISLRTITGDVRISDGSGDITVQTDGAFTLVSDGSGSVTEL